MAPVRKIRCHFILRAPACLSTVTAVRTALSGLLSLLDSIYLSHASRHCQVVSPLAVRAALTYLTRRGVGGDWPTGVSDLQTKSIDRSTSAHDVGPVPHTSEIDTQKASSIAALLGSALTERAFSKQAAEAHRSPYCRQHPRPHSRTCRPTCRRSQAPLPVACARPSWSLQPKQPPASSPR